MIYDSWEMYKYLQDKIIFVSEFWSFLKCLFVIKCNETNLIKDTKKVYFHLLQM